MTDWRGYVGKDVKTMPMPENGALLHMFERKGEDFQFINPDHSETPFGVLDKMARRSNETDFEDYFRTVESSPEGFLCLPCTIMSPDKGFEAYGSVYSTTEIGIMLDPAKLKMIVVLAGDAGTFFSDGVLELKVKVDEYPVNEELIIAQGLRESLGVWHGVDEMYPNDFTTQGATDPKVSSIMDIRARIAFLRMMQLAVQTDIQTGMETEAAVNAGIEAISAVVVPITLANRYSREDFGEDYQIPHPRALLNAAFMQRVLAKEYGVEVPVVIYDDEKPAELVIVEPTRKFIEEQLQKFEEYITPDSGTMPEHARTQLEGFRGYYETHKEDFPSPALGRG
jgi:hypothetical protein